MGGKSVSKVPFKIVEREMLNFGFYGFVHAKDPLSNTTLHAPNEKPGEFRLEKTFRLCGTVHGSELQQSICCMTQCGARKIRLEFL